MAAPLRSARLAEQKTLTLVLDAPPLPNDADLRLNLKDVRKRRRAERYYEEHKCGILVIAAGLVVGACVTTVAILSGGFYLVTKRHVW